MHTTSLAVRSQTWFQEQFDELVERLLPTVDDDVDRIDVDDTQIGRSRARLAAWIVLLGVFVVAGAVAWAACLSRGYRGFSGEVKFHTKWKIPIGIKLECF